MGQSQWRITNIDVYIQKNLTQSWPVFPFYTPWKHLTTFGFPVVSWGINENIGQKWVKQDLIKVRGINKLSL